MTYTASPSLYSGSVYDYVGINKLIENINLFSTRTFYQTNTATPPTDLNNATVMPTYATIQSYSLLNNYLPSVFIFSATITRSAAVNNTVQFALFRNGTRVAYAGKNINRATTLYDQVNLVFPIGPDVVNSTDTWDIKWAMATATAVTVTMPVGYRITHFQI